MNQIGRKSFPTFKIYTDVSDGFGYHKCYELPDTYTSYNVKYQAGYDTIYEIELNLIPDGFIEDMTLWGPKDIEIFWDERVIPDNGDVYDRTTIYSCGGNPPTIQILEESDCVNDNGASHIKLIMNGRWRRKKENN